MDTTNEKYIAPESEEIKIAIESHLLEGSTEGDLGCSDDDCPKDY